MEDKAKYGISIYWSEEDGYYVAEVPELLGCAADGPTYDAALAAAREAIDRWLAVARKRGQRIPNPAGRSALVAA